MEEVVNQIQALYNLLATHSKIKVLNFKIYPSLGTEAIEEILKKTSFTASTEIMTFYSQCNGFILRWVHKDEPYFNQELDNEVLNDLIPLPLEILTDSSFRTTGCIFISGFDDVFFPSWKNYTNGVNEMDIDLIWYEYFENFPAEELFALKDIRPIDFISKHKFMGIDTNQYPITTVSYFDGVKKREDMTNTNFESYLINVINDFGLVNEFRLLNKIPPEDKKSDFVFASNLHFLDDLNNL